MVRHKSKNVIDPNAIILAQVTDNAIIGAFITAKSAKNSLVRVAAAILIS